MPNAIEVNKFRSQMCMNSHQIYVFSFEEMDKLIAGAKRRHTSPTRLAAWERLRNRYLRPTWNGVHQKVEFAASYGTVASDIHTLGLLLSDLGWFGARAYVRVYRGVPHIILKGKIGARKFFTAARYSLENKKVIKLALGKMGAIEDAKEGGIWTFVLLTVYRVVDCVMGDATIIQTEGRLTTDAVKLGIVTGASIAASAGISAIGTAAAESSFAGLAAMGGFAVAAGPLIAVVLVGVVLGMGLEALDDHYHITERVVAGLDELSTKGIAELKLEKKKLMQTTKRLANQVDSVIDYATNKVEPIMIHSWHSLAEWAAPVRYLRKML